MRAENSLKRLRVVQAVILLRELGCADTKLCAVFDETCEPMFYIKVGLTTQKKVSVLGFLERGNHGTVDCHFECLDACRVD